MAYIEFNPLSPVFRVDPYPVYDKLRAAAPVFYWEKWGIWFLTRYEDCHALLRNNRLGHGTLGEPPPAEHPLVKMQSNWMLFKNPPDHTRLRTLVNKAFTPRRIERLRGQIQAIANRLLNQVVAAGHMDLIADFAYPLPVTVIANMLGVPSGDYPLFHAWSNDIARTLDLTDETAVYERGATAAAALTAYLQTLIAERRADPQDDLLSALAAAEEAGDRLNEDELYATCALLLIAGHETTINLIGNGTLALLNQPDQLKKLKHNPDLIKSAVEELLRYDSPVQMTSRIALETVTGTGYVFEKGQEVFFMLGAANRDPAKFKNPHRLDITRAPNNHLAFGGGIHYCLGAPLARLEGQIAIKTLLERLPTLKLETDIPIYVDNYLLRGLKTLPVSF